MEKWQTENVCNMQLYGCLN